MFLSGFVILILEMEFAMALKKLRRGWCSPAAPLARLEPGTQRFSGAFRSRRRQLRQTPINPPLAWGRRSASEHCVRRISSRPPCLRSALSTAGSYSTSRLPSPVQLRTRHKHALHSAPRPQERTTHTYSIL
ncbi:unnamed protein product [Leptosia nina]|uniref:Secreted protein n=1 Tax=Leptosia nina TaxID=320188 RepID=A0AAV1K3Q7_9NEOP